jgi:hypothetical protein
MFTRYTPRSALLTLTLGSLLGALILSGCEEPCPWGEEDEPSIDSFSATSPTVTAGGDIELSFELSFFGLTGEEGHHDDEDGDEDDEEDEDEHASSCPAGHVHIYLNDLLTNPLGMPNTETATITIPEDTVAGEHTLIARLHNADHTILTVGEDEVTAELLIIVDEIVIGR